MIKIITLNRPEKRNALNIELLQYLKKQLEEALDARVVVLKGEGKVFCSGMDLSEVEDRDISARLLADVFTLLYSLPGVTIGVLQGAAVAGGAGLLAACDIVVAEEKALIGFPEVKRGLVASLVMVFLKRQMKERDLRELVLLGELISAAKGKEMGLITRVVANVEREVEQIIKTVLEGAPGAIKETKMLLQGSFEEELAQVFASHRKMRLSLEAKEGAAAFFEGRTPKWQDT